MRQRKSTRRSYPPLSDRRIEQMALAQGALAAKVISPAAVHTGNWVRWKCQFGCDGFGSSLVCPPHTPAPEQTRRMLDEYCRAVLFESPLRQAKKIAAALERELFLSGYYKAFGLVPDPAACAPRAPSKRVVVTPNRPGRRWRLWALTFMPPPAGRVLPSTSSATVPTRSTTSAWCSSSDGCDATRLVIRREGRHPRFRQRPASAETARGRCCPARTAPARRRRRQSR